MNLCFLLRAARASARRIAEAAQAPESETDPIDHPAIAAMNLRELADLPLSPRRPAPARPDCEPPAPPPSSVVA
jgi:hypothetical protein